jgi:hypothetical protein
MLSTNHGSIAEPDSDAPDILESNEIRLWNGAYREVTLRLGDDVDPIVDPHEFQEIVKARALKIMRERLSAAGPFKIILSLEAGMSRNDGPERLHNFSTGSKRKGSAMPIGQSVNLDDRIDNLFAKQRSLMEDYEGRESGWKITRITKFSSQIFFQMFSLAWIEQILHWTVFSGHWMGVS